MSSDYLFSKTVQVWLRASRSFQTTFRWKVDGTILLQVGTGGNVGMDLLGYGSIQKRFTISCHFPPGKIVYSVVV